jgi:hypothetical protein
MKKIILSVILIAIFLIACGGKENKAEEQKETTQKSGGVGYTILVSGAQSGITEPMDTIITNETELDSLWKDHYSYMNITPEPPSIDFKQDVVVGVFLGDQPTTGFWIRLDSVYIKQDQEIVAMTMNSGPDTSAVVLEMVTQPFVIAAITKTDKHIQFDIQAQQ